MGQTVLIEDDFSADPAVDWQLNGAAEWDAANGCVIMTRALDSQAATMFFREVQEINNFKLEAQVKLCCGSGADGMTVTFVEDDGVFQPTSIGDAGGGMCVANLTSGRQIVVEFDIWGNDAACESCAADGRTDAGGNHVGVEHSPTGWQGCIPNDANANSACASDAGIGFDLFGDYLVDIVVQVQDAVVTVDIGSADTTPPVPLHRVITFTLQDYVSFHGYVGVSASTGGSNAEQSIYSLKLTSLPPGTCLLAPASLSRAITGSRTRALEWSSVEAYEIGVPVDVTIQIDSLRDGAGACQTPTELTVEEVLPENWTAENVSDGGSFADGAVSWVLTGASLTAGTTVSYDAVPGGENRIVQFAGTVRESNVPDPQPAGIGGDGELLPFDGLGFEEEGFITKWLTLGPVMQPGGDVPGEDIIVLDYLTDGSLDERSILPREGDVIEPDYNQVAASTGLADTPERPDLNPGGAPTWLAWYDADDTITYDETMYGTVDNVMAYAVTYVTNEMGNSIRAFVGLASDDSIQVLLNGSSIWVNNVSRGSGEAHEIQDVAVCVLNPGVNRLMTKVFEGGGGHEFRLRFQDADGRPITDGLSVSLVPPADGCPVPPVQVNRAIALTGTIDVELVPVPAYEAGTTLEVVLSLDSVRSAGGGCEAAGDVTIVEFLPDGWTATDITGNGTLSDGAITWNISAAELGATSQLRYNTSGPATAQIMGIAGMLLEDGNSLSFSVGGDGTFATDRPFADGGFITTWLALGPFMQSGGAEPGEEVIRRDYLTDGVGITEANIVPIAFMEVETNYGLAASDGLHAGPAEINPTGLPMWFPWRDANEHLDLGNFGPPDNAMAYGVCYLEVEATREVAIACGSDDSIQVLLDNQEIWINNIERGWGGGDPTDVSPPFTLAQGGHRLMAKVFQGTGDWSFGIRLQDSVTGEPITSGFTVTLEPPEMAVETFKRGDSNRDGSVNIADAVYILQNLFASGPPILCMDAADSNDDEGVNIADAIYILQNLFASGPPIPAPGPDACGPDPTPHPTGGVDLDCTGYCPEACQDPPVPCP